MSQEESSDTRFEKSCCKKGLATQEMENHVLRMILRHENQKVMSQELLSRQKLKNSPQLRD